MSFSFCFSVTLFSMPELGCSIRGFWESVWFCKCFLNELFLFLADLFHLFSMALLKHAQSRGNSIISLLYPSPNFNYYWYFGHSKSLKYFYKVFLIELYTLKKCPYDKCWISQTQHTHATSIWISKYNTFQDIINLPHAFQKYSPSLKDNKVVKFLTA